jgi:hypothetical protein
MNKQKLRELRGESIGQNTWVRFIDALLEEDDDGTEPVPERHYPAGMPVEVWDGEKQSVQTGGGVMSNDNWISVNTITPYPGRIVLVWDTYEGVVKATLQDDANEVIWCPVHPCTLGLDAVTHWMPLPDSPEADDETD